MKMSRVSKVLLALAILGFLISFPALAQETKKPTIPWTGKLRDGREITKDDLAQIIYQRYRWIESKGKEGRLTDLRQANLKEAYLLAAWLNNINLYYANLSEANLFKAHLYGAILTGTDLSGANLIEADLRRAKLFDTNLKGAEIGSADLSEAWFEPKPGTLPDVSSLVFVKGLSSLRYSNSPHGLVELRELFKKEGVREQERQVTYAINHTRREKLMEGGFFGKLEGAFQYVFFELTCQYGMSPGRPLEILGVGLLVFIFPYLLALWSRDRETGIWLLLPPDRILGKGGKYPPFKLSHRTPFRPLPKDSTRFGENVLRGLRVLRLAFYFSLLSAFRLGWRELNVGSWIARLQRHEYTLGATGWPRTVAGFQSLLSVYLVALWALTYFSRPFD